MLSFVSRWQWIINKRKEKCNFYNHQRCNLWLSTVIRSTKKWRFEWFPVMLLYQTSNFREDLGLLLWVLRHQGGPTHPAKMVCGESWSQYLHTWKHSSVDLFLDLISNRFPRWASRLGPREVAPNPWKHGPSENECYAVFLLGIWILSLSTRLVVSQLSQKNL